MHAPNALSIQGLTHRYPNGTTALSSVDLEVQPGDFFALLGPNGAGKTTLISAVSGLLRPDAGTLRVFGHDVHTDAHAAKQCLGLVPQEFNFNMFSTVWQVVTQYAGYFGIPLREAAARAEPILQALNLWEKRHKTSRSLSGGMKRRLMIARAMILEPQLLILDEPTAGVDVELRHQTWDYLSACNARGLTIILTTHYLEEAEALCNRLAIIQQGELIASGNMSDYLSQLQQETFVVTLKTPLDDDTTLPNPTWQQRDAWTLEIQTSPDHSFEQALTQLHAHNLCIQRIQSKANRLESLFFRLTGAST